MYAYIYIYREREIEGMCVCVCLCGFRYSFEILGLIPYFTGAKFKGNPEVKENVLFRSRKMKENDIHQTNKQQFCHRE